MRSRACPVRDAFSRGVPALAQTREPRKPRPILRWPNTPRPRELRPCELRPRELRPRELRPRELRPRELRPRELRPRELRPGEWPREEAPRSQPRAGDFGPADPRRVPVSRASEPPRENLGARPASPPPAEPIRLPRCRRGDERPTGAGRPKTADRLNRDDERPDVELRPREAEERLNTDPPSRDRPMLELPNLEPPSPEPRSPEPRSPEPRSPEPRSPEPRSPEPRSAEPRSAEPRSAEPPGLALPSSEPPSTPSRRLPPNLTLDALAPCPSRYAVVEVLGPARPSLSRGSRRATNGRPAPGPRRPPIAPGPLSRSDSRRLFPPASCRIAPWFAPGTGARAWLADQPARRPSPRAPARRSAAATAYSTNGHRSTS